MSRVYQREEKLLSIEKLNISFGSKVILRDVNLSVDNITRSGYSQGQCVALLGPSGIGKTQLFRTIAGLQKPSSGEVKVFDKGIGAAPAAGRIGVLQQAYPLLNHRTVLDNLKLCAKSYGKDTNKKIDEELSIFGLLDKKNSYPLELSGGQRQRIAIIQQLLCSNHMMLMDEPFSGLDPIAKERVYDTIDTITTTHELNTVIFITHDIASAVRLADEIWIIGREKDKIGATVIKRMDMIVRGLAWDKNINKNPEFWKTVNEINEMFKTL